MNVHVYDTHVKTDGGHYLHFDVLVDDEHRDQASQFAQYYLHSLGVKDAEIRWKACQFCHSRIGDENVQAGIKANGYYIWPIEGCPEQ